jgi:hypothetical protein
MQRHAWPANKLETPRRSYAGFDTWFVMDCSRSIDHLRSSNSSQKYKCPAVMAKATVSVLTLSV